MSEEERRRRWRLVLGGEAASSCGTLGDGDIRLDGALDALYGDTTGRSGGLGPSYPHAARWLGDIREYFPASVVRVLQQDAFTRLDLKRMLLEPEMLQAMEPDVHLVANLLALGQVIPAKSKETARLVVRRVVEDLERRLAEPLRSAVAGALNRATRNRRPKHSEIDWHRTIRANLRHWQPNLRTVIPETRIGFGRRRRSLRDIVICLDQSGSMGASVVYSGIFGSVLASLPAVSTRMVVFDTAVADLSEQLQDPVDLLFGVQLGGGTDIAQALAYCQGVITRPEETILVLVTDLYEGGDPRRMRAIMEHLRLAGVQVITLLALNDSGAPAYDHGHAAHFSALGIPCFACTPDLFPGLIATAINRGDVASWAAAQGLAVARAEEA